MVEWTPGFHQAAATGHEWATYIADHLRGYGLTVYQPALELAQTRDQVAQFTRKEQDLVVRITGRESHVLECKSRTIRFNSSPGSFPYPSAIVAAVDAWEGKDKEPLATVLVSQRTGGMLVIPTSTKPHWWQAPVTHGARGHTYPGWHVDRWRMVPIGSLVGRLLDRKGRMAR